MQFEPSRPLRRPAAVLCDAVGTLVWLDRPIERLRGSLAARGVPVTQAEAEAAFAAELRFYRAHHLEGVDLASITRLRRNCADEMRAHLAHELDHERAYSLLMGLLRFEVLPGTRESLARLRAAGIKLAVVSNWDASLETALLTVGLRQEFDAVISSAAVGAAKPDPAPLTAALQALGADASQAVMIGDNAVDVEAAYALGMPCARVPSGAGIKQAVDALLELPA